MYQINFGFLNKNFVRWIATKRFIVPIEQLPQCIILGIRKKLSLNQEKAVTCPYLEKPFTRFKNIYHALSKSELVKILLMQLVALCLIVKLVTLLLYI